MTLPFQTAARAAARASAYAALALTACAAIGRAQALPPADPPAAGPPASDPHAAVPATRYENPIGYRTDPAPQARPDQTWVQSNAAVAGMDSMAPTMTGMRGAMPHSMPPMPAASAPAAPAPAPTPHPADSATPHDHGAMHGDMPMPMPAAHAHRAEER